MAYGKKADAILTVPKMGDVDADELSWTRVQAFIDTYIDNHLRGYYVVPFTKTGAGDDNQADNLTIREMALQLYAGYAMAIRYTEDDPNRLDNNFFWKQGMKMLKRIRKGIIQLDVATSTKETQDTYIKTRVTTLKRPGFNYGTELDWENDPLVEPDINDVNYHQRVNPEDVSTLDRRHR